MDLTNLTDEEKKAAEYAFDELCSVQDEGPVPEGWASAKLATGRCVIREALKQLGVEVY